MVTLRHYSFSMGTKVIILVVSIIVSETLGIPELSRHKGLLASHVAAHTGNIPTFWRLHYGGSVTSIQKYPWVVSIQHSSHHICSGSILSATKIITASHCIYGLSPGAIKLRVGSLDFRSGGQLLFATSFHIHPKYLPDKLEYDIAIITIKERIKFHSRKLSAIALPSQFDSVEVDTNATLVGWEYCESCGAHKNVVKSNLVKVISNTHCNSYYRGEVEYSFLCAEGMTNGSTNEVCQRDTGGPVVDMESQLLVGIVIWGHGCNSPARPGVYTRTAYYRDWIDTFL